MSLNSWTVTSPTRKILSCGRRRIYSLDALQVVAAQIVPALLGIRPEKSPSRLVGITWMY